MNCRCIYTHVAENASTFINDSNQPITVFWISPIECNRTAQYTSLQTGRNYTINNVCNPPNTNPELQPNQSSSYNYPTPRENWTSIIVGLPQSNPDTAYIMAANINNTYRASTMLDPLQLTRTVWTEPAEAINPAVQQAYQFLLEQLNRFLGQFGR